MGLPLHARPVAHANPAWLPANTGLDGLESIRREHGHYLTGMNEAGDAVAAIVKRHELEDAARREALRAAAHGRQVRLPKETTPERRARELNDAQERFDAAEAALGEFLDEAMEEIRDSWPSWDQILADRAAEAEQERAEAERLLAVATAKALEIRRLRIHLERNATGGDHWLIAWDDLPAPTPIPQPDLTDATGAIANA
jgi:hypothetical protein